MDRARELFEIDDEVSLRILWKLYRGLMTTQKNDSGTAAVARVVLEYRLGKPFIQSGPPRRPLDSISVVFNNVLESTANPEAIQAEGEAGAEELPPYSIETGVTEEEDEE
jgi:hypothetical protein